MCIERFVCLFFSHILRKFFSSRKLVLEQRSPISKLPDELLLRLFTFYLNPYDLFHRCIGVNKQWKSIVSDRSIWKIVNPINWARGEIGISKDVWQ